MIKLPITSESALKKFMREHQVNIFETLVDSIAEELDKDVPEFPVVLWQFGESAYYGVIILENCSVALSAAMDYFVKNEMYEKAAKCRDLISNVALEDVIKYEG